MTVSTIVIAPFARWSSTNRRRPQLLPSPTCSGLVANHDAVDPRPYVVGTHGFQRPLTACRGCIEVVASLTTVISERRGP